MSDHTFSATTRAVRAGIATDREHGAVVPPIHLSSTFAFEGFNKPRKFDYTRSGNPTRSQLADALASLEGGAGAVVTSTGMSAVALAVQLLNPGDVCVAAHDCYGGTQRLLRGLAKRGHFEVVFADLTRPAALDLIAARRPRLVWIETPSNPLLKIIDIEAIAKIAREKKIISVSDNTFATPWIQRPIEAGFDMVIHSATKYLNGHSDMVGGVIVVGENKVLADQIAFLQNSVGAIAGPFDSFLALRGLKTLALRMERHCSNALEIARWLEDQPQVKHVYYPGLKTHPQHDLARQQMRGFGGIVTIILKTDLEGTRRFLESTHLFALAESLGGVESLIDHPAIMTHASVPKDQREKLGITDSLVRLSVGVEGVRDLIDDLQFAFEAI